MIDTNHSKGFKNTVNENYALFKAIEDKSTLKAPNTTIAEFANTADPDETAHNEPSHLGLQCLHSSP